MVHLFSGVWIDLLVAVFELPSANCSACNRHLDWDIDQEIFLSDACQRPQRRFLR
jgi:hypothetical protein